MSVRLTSSILRNLLRTRISRNVTALATSSFYNLPKRGQFTGRKNSTENLKNTQTINLKNSKNQKNALTEILDNPADAIRDIKSNSTLLIGGFGLVGVPEALIKEIAKTDIKDLTIISNEGGVNDHGLDILFDTHQIRKMICSFIGENKEFQRQFLSGELEVELTPQGTLIEKIRAGGAGIPAFYTPTGVNTLVHLGGEPIRFGPDGALKIKSTPKESRIFEGRTFVLEQAIKADFALIKGWKADKAGNIIFRKSACNFNLSMAKAAKVTIAEVEEIVEVGELDPNFIHLPSIYVDRIVKPPFYEKYIEVNTTRPENLNFKMLLPSKFFKERPF